jgi:hypothetical protein
LKINNSLPDGVGGLPVGLDPLTMFVLSGYYQISQGGNPDA